MKRAWRGSRYERGKREGEREREGLVIYLYASSVWMDEDCLKAITSFLAFFLLFFLLVAWLLGCFVPSWLVVWLGVCGNVPTDGSQARAIGNLMTLNLKFEEAHLSADNGDNHFMTSLH